MANTREIQERIDSVKDTMKITNAMYMISSIKLKRARQTLLDSEPYYHTIERTMHHLFSDLGEVEHPYFPPVKELEQSEKRIVTVVLTGDKGLAGAFNSNVLKEAEKAIREEGIHQLIPVGQVGFHALQKSGVPIIDEFVHFGHNPGMHHARALAYRTLEMYEDKKVDEVHIIYTQVKNAAEEEVQRVQLLPVKRKSLLKVYPEPDMSEVDKTVLLPSAYDVIDSVIPNFIIGFIYGALVDSHASEHNARVRAMEAATRNGEEMLKELSLLFNQARQGAITQEITEIISGAKALRMSKNR